MTEVPEHLLKRAAEARAKASGGDAGGDEPAPAADTAAAAPAPAAAAPAPAVAEEAPAPEPVAPYVEAGLERKTIPAWIIPVLLFLPIWAIYYVGYLERPPQESEGLLAIGEEVYAVSCAGCHGGTGGGGSGRQLNDGEVLLTFPSAAAGSSYDGLTGQLAWVANGTANTPGSTYGDPGRVGGARAPGSFGSPMGGFGDALSTEELLGVVLYERMTHGGLDADAASAELHTLQALVVIAEEQGIHLDSAIGLDAVQALVDEARVAAEEGVGATAGGDDH